MGIKRCKNIHKFYPKNTDEFRRYISWQEWNVVGSRTMEKDWLGGWAWEADRQSANAR